MGTSDKETHLQDIIDEHSTLPPVAGDESLENALPVGSLIAGKYEIVDLLGSGGMSAVYSAKHLLTGQIIALKILLTHSSQSKNIIMRFRQEAQTTSRLNHPNIVRMFDFGVTADGAAYLTMDYLEGLSLSELIKSEGALQPARALKLFMQAADAFIHAHHEGIVHRDLKPSNLMVCHVGTAEESLKVVDFGIAKRATEGDGAQELTRTGEVLGSPLYMSPEQCSGNAADARSDIYSMGCVMYEALCGEPPFRGDSIYTTIRMHAEDVPARFKKAKSHLRGALADELESIVLKCMSKNPADRFQSMAELLDALKKAQSKLGAVARFDRYRATLSFKRGSHKNKSLFVVLSLLAVWFSFVMLSVSGFRVNLSDVQEFCLEMDEAIHNPAGSATEQWFANMERGTDHLNHGTYDRAEKSLRAALENAALISDARAQLNCLDQLRVLYTIKNDPLGLQSVKTATQAAERRYTDGTNQSNQFLLGAIGMIPEKPSENQKKQIYELIHRSIAVANEYAAGEDPNRGQSILRTLLEKVERSLPVDDRELINLKLSLSSTEYPLNSGQAFALAETLPIGLLSTEDKAVVDVIFAHQFALEHDYTKSQAYLMKAIADLEPRGASLALARAYGQLGANLLKQDQFAEAIPNMKKASAFYIAIGRPQAAAANLNLAADALARTGHSSDADLLIDQYLATLDQKNISQLFGAAELYLTKSWTGKRHQVDELLSKKYAFKALRCGQLSMRITFSKYQPILLACLQETTGADGMPDDVLGLGIARELHAVGRLNEVDSMAAMGWDSEIAALYKLRREAEARKEFKARVQNFLLTPKGTIPLWNEALVFDIGALADRQVGDSMINLTEQAISDNIGSKEHFKEIANSMRWLARLYCTDLYKTDTTKALEQFVRAEKFMDTHEVGSGVRYPLLYDFSHALLRMGREAESVQVRKRADAALAGK